MTNVVPPLRAMPAEAPTLETERLILRPFTVADAPAVQRLAGEKTIADNTLNIPHPYADGMAEAWIGSHDAALARGESLVLAVTLSGEGLIGAIGLNLDRPNRRGELGYWIAVPHWGRGFATEAAKAVIRYGFQSLGLNRIEANHLTRNPASGRVLAKVGMRLEGVHRQHVLKNGVFEDLARYAILAADPAAP